MLEVAPKVNEMDEGAICFIVSAQSFVQMAGTCWLFDGLFSVGPFLTLGPFQSESGGVVQGRLTWLEAAKILLKEISETSCHAL